MGHWSDITDAELDIMKALWKTGPTTSPAIFAAMETERSRHIGTNKTLLTRLVQKGAIKREALNSRNYIYSPAISEEAYANENRRWTIEKVFNGNAMEMLASLIKYEKITREDIDLVFAQNSKRNRKERK